VPATLVVSRKLAVPASIGHQQKVGGSRGTRIASGVLSNKGHKNEVARATQKEAEAVEQITVRNAAKRLNRPAESVRKVIDARRVEKHYASGKRFRILWADIEKVYLEIEAAGR
jgi:hypothetical protein